MKNILKDVILEHRSVEAQSGMQNTSLYSQLVSTTKKLNPLRQLGTSIVSSDDKILIAIDDMSDGVTTLGNNVSSELPVNDLGATAVVSSPVQFSIIQPVYRRLLALYGNQGLADMLIDGMKNRITDIEIDYMINGVVDDSNKHLLLFDGSDNVSSNQYSLFNAAMPLNTTETTSEGKIADLLNAPSSDVLKNATFLINKPAFKLAQTLKFANGEPMLKAVLTQNVSGATYQLGGFNAIVQDGMKTTEPNKALFYFGNFKAFVVQDDPSQMTAAYLKQIPQTTDRNMQALKVDEFTEGKLVQSINDPQIFKLEV